MVIASTICAILYFFFQAASRSKNFRRYDTLTYNKPTPAPASQYWPDVLDMIRSANIMYTQPRFVLQPWPSFFYYCITTVGVWIVGKQRGLGDGGGRTLGQSLCLHCVGAWRVSAFSPYLPGACCL